MHGDTTKVEASVRRRAGDPPRHGQSRSLTSRWTQEPGATRSPWRKPRDGSASTARPCPCPGWSGDRRNRGARRDAEWPRPKDQLEFHGGGADGTDRPGAGGRGGRSLRGGGKGRGGGGEGG